MKTILILTLAFTQPGGAAITSEQIQVSDPKECERIGQLWKEKKRRIQYRAEFNCLTFKAE